MYQVLTKDKCRQFALILALLSGFCDGRPALGQNLPRIEVRPSTTHSGTIWSIDLSADGKYVITAGRADATTRMWDAASGRLIRIYPEPKQVDWVGFAPDGISPMSASGGKLTLWDRASQRALRTFEGHTGPINAVKISPNRQWLLTASEDKTVRLWDAASGRALATLVGHAGEVLDAAFSPDGRFVLSGANDKSMILWDAASAQPLRTFHGHIWGVRSVAFSPDGRLAVSAGASVGDNIRIWDISSGQTIRTLDGHTADIFTVAFSPDGSQILSTSRNEAIVWDTATGSKQRQEPKGVTTAAWANYAATSIRHPMNKLVWELASGAIAHSLPGHAQLGVNQVATTADARLIVTADAEQQLRLWDGRTGKLIRRFHAHTTFNGPPFFSPDGTLLADGGKIWETNSGRVILSLPGNPAFSVFSPDGKWVAITSIDHGGRFDLLDAKTGAVVRSFKGQEHSAADPLQFTADSRRILSGGVYYDESPRLWDVASGNLLQTFEGNWEGGSHIVMSNDGQTFAISDNDAVTLWRAGNAKPLHRFSFDAKKGKWRNVVFSHDGNTLLALDSHELTFLDIGSGRVQRSIPFPCGACGHLTLSLDGRLIATTSGPPYEVTLRAIDTGKVVRALRLGGRDVDIGLIAISPDQTRLATSNPRDGTVKIWALDRLQDIPLLTLYSGQDGPDHWLSMTEQGFFNAGPRGEELVSLVNGIEVISVKQAFQSLFNPDLVREALAGDPNGEVGLAASVLNLDKVIGSGPSPDVAILSPDEGAVTSTDLVTVSTRVTDKGRGIGRIEWRVNGITAVVMAKSPRTRVIDQKLSLDPGENTIEVVAYNASNLLSSLPAKTTVRLSSAAQPVKPKLHVLAVGINSYTDRGWTPPGAQRPSAFGPLTLAVKDATVLAAAFKEAGAGQYASVSVTPLHNGQATKSGIELAIDGIAAALHPRDTFVLFVAGHGYTSAGRFYLIPQDYQGGANPESLAARAIGQDQLQEWLARIKAKRALVLLDTCESGALIGGHLQARTEGAEAAVGRLHEATGRPILTAAASGQFAYEDSEARLGVRHGLFTAAVLDALRRGDTNGNQLIELSEIVAHVQTEVPRLAAKLGGRGVVKSAVGGELVQPRLEQSARFGSRGEDFAVTGVLR